MDEGELLPPDAAPPATLGLTWPPPRRVWTAQDDAFIASIREDPNDDTPRLIYADWLTDQDDPRGLFIRLDVACLHESDPLRLRWLLRDRKRLLQRYEEFWSPGDRVVAIGGFTRGFLEAVTMTPRQILEHGEAVFSREPIHELHLQANEFSPIVAMTRCPCLHHVERLRIDYERGDILPSMFHAPTLGRVHALTLNPVSEHARHVLVALDLARSPLLPQLRTLRLPGLPTVGLRILLDTPGFAIERLEVPGTQRDTGVVPAWDDESSAIVDVPSIDIEGLRLLAEHPAAGSLRYLDASFNPVSLALPQIRNAPHLKHLETIRIAPRREIAVRESAGTLGGPNP
jgi:uncharacterized protein (TIGR02996 family)